MFTGKTLSVIKLDWFIDGSTQLKKSRKEKFFFIDQRISCENEKVEKNLNAN